jgi:cyclophilin family peptidyl-prolyl cis-trans isomerase/HEAT repeat protein
VPPPPPPDSSPDLAVLVKDSEARVRRRAALALGRVGLPEGVAPLTATLTDPDPDVRAMAAFGLGLLGTQAASAEAPLTALLADPTPLVRGRAAEALGQIGATNAAAAIGKVAAEYARSAPVGAMQPDDETWPAAPEAEAFKLALFALVRLKAYEPLAGAVLDDGKPVSAWWPVAYALQRIADERAVPALQQLLPTPGRYTRSFAIRGLGTLKQTSAVEPLLRLLEPSAKTPLEVMVAAVRALADIGATAAAEPLASIAVERGTHANLRLEAVTALGRLRAPAGLPAVQDLITDEWPTMRAAAIRAAGAIDQENFVSVLSGLELDRDWRPRAALAEILGTFPPDIALARVRGMLQDEDKRVIPSVLAALEKLKAPDLPDILLEKLKDSDFAVRATAARELGETKAPAGAEALREAYKGGLPDAPYAARAAALDGLAQYGPAEARETLTAALTDKDWAIRVHAADLLTKIDATAAADSSTSMRPAPGTPPAPYDDPQLISPDLSPHAFIETTRGTIELELAVLDAPQTSRNFMALAEKGFFNGLQVHRVVPNFVVQDGDPRGDGEGGPGYSIRDELNDRPYLRGTVGMALEWRDTGGSQFFITHSPQPHLDGRYTAFGHVVNGMDVVDRIQQGDVIQRIRIWDGKGWREKTGATR